MFEHLHYTEVLWPIQFTVLIENTNQWAVQFLAYTVQCTLQPTGSVRYTAARPKFYVQRCHTMLGCYTNLVSYQQENCGHDA